jgi:PAS domain S-box-containing protein
MDKQTSLEFTVFHPRLGKWLAVRLYPFQDGLYSYCQDITERKQAEEQLQLQPNTLWEMSKSVIATDLQGKIIYWNEGASRLFGYSAQEMLGKTLTPLYPRLEQQQLAADLEQIRNGKDYVGLWQGRRKDGRTVWIDIKTTLLHDTEGKPIGYIGIAQEASANKPVVEQFLYYARLAQNQMDAVIATDTNYNILSWNEAAERLYGWKEEEVRHKFVDDILHTEYFTTTGTEASKRLLSKGYWKGEVIQRRKDGARLLILASVSVIKDGAGKMMGVIAANRDISELEERRPLESNNQIV